MPNKISTTHLVAVLFATFLLISAIPLGAEETCPPTTGKAGPFTITLVGGAPTADGDNWVWTYEFTAFRPGMLCYIQKWLLTFPVCCGDDIEIVAPAFVHITPPCKSALFGRKWPMVCDDFTLKLPFTKKNKKNGIVSITTTTNNIGINTVGIKTVNNFFVAAIAGPACAGVVIPTENEPVASRTLFVGADFNWELLYDSLGNSFDANCVPESACLKATLTVEEISVGNGIFKSLPVDKAIVTGDSPGCTYVMTRSGGVKRLCTP